MHRAVVNYVQSIPIPTPIHCNSFYSIPIPIQFLSIQFFQFQFSFFQFNFFNSICDHSIPIPTPIHVTKVNHKSIQLMCIQGGDTVYYCNFLIY